MPTTTPSSAALPVLTDTAWCDWGIKKGATPKKKLHRNFGMPRPEGYRKALRLMHLAEKFRMPVLTFVDTPGATLVSARKSATNPKPSAKIFTN